jgi:hypothetical protein
MLATAPPVLSAGAPVPEAEALWLAEAEALWLAEAEAEAEPVAAAAAEVARLAGTETEIPADSQIPARMGTSLAWSSGWHLLETHEVTDLVMAAWPVVHWHLTSETPQPEAGMAATRQGTAQLGTWDRSGVWAETTTSEAAAAAMVEKRMVMDVCGLLFLKTERVCVSKNVPEQRTLRLKRCI